MRAGNKLATLMSRSSRSRRPIPRMSTPPAAVIAATVRVGFSALVVLVYQGALTAVGVVGRRSPP